MKKSQNLSQPTFTVMHLVLAALVGGAMSYLLLTGSFMESESMPSVVENGMQMSMSGMTDALRDVDGNEFDKKFLELMYDHHQGALDMAELAKVKAEAKEVKTMADAIVTAQTAEMDDMRTWYQDWGYGELGAPMGMGSGMEPKEEISWTEAQKLLNDCEVMQATETHTAGLQLTLKDGTMKVANDFDRTTLWDKVNAANKTCGGSIGIAIE